MSEWRNIPHFSDYEINEYGKIRRIINRNGFSKGRELKLNPDYYGYLVAYLSDNKKKYKIRVHNLVAWAFIGPQPMGCGVHHKNGNKIDNYYCNLEYVTYSDHRKLHYTETRYMKGCKLTPNDVIKIRKSCDINSFDYYANQYNVTRRTIYNVVNYKTWNNL